MFKLQKLNVLIAGDGISINYVRCSKYLNKLYITSENEFENAINISFNTFLELAKKCKALKIDIVLVENEKWIMQGISDVLRRNFINCLAIDSRWAAIFSSKKMSKNLVEKYGIKVPKTLAYPSEFPVIVKSDSLVKSAYTISEAIGIRNEISKLSENIAKSIFLEEYLTGQNLILTSVFDGKNLITLPNVDIPKETIKEYNLKLQNMLVGEGANFIGFFNSKIIYNGKIFNVGFDFAWSNFEFDILYLAISMIYQKLDEISFER